MDTSLLVEIALQSRDPAWRRLDNEARIVRRLHSLSRPPPNAGDAKELIGEVWAVRIRVDQTRQLILAAFVVRRGVFLLGSRR